MAEAAIQEHVQNYVSDLAFRPTLELISMIMLQHCICQTGREIAIRYVEVNGTRAHLTIFEMQHQVQHQVCVPSQRCSYSGKKFNGLLSQGDSGFDWGGLGDAFRGAPSTGSRRTVKPKEEEPFYGFTELFKVSLIQRHTILSSLGTCICACTSQAICYIPGFS